MRILRCAKSSHRAQDEISVLQKDQRVKDLLYTSGRTEGQERYVLCLGVTFREWVWLSWNGRGLQGVLMYCTPSQLIQYVDILLTEKRATYRRRSHLYLAPLAQLHL